MQKTKENNFTVTDIEILVATMNRSNFDFLDRMFQNNRVEGFSVLIINQTSQEKQLVSKQPNIRVINSFEKGLSKSRNLALKNAQKELLVITDDDVVFVEGFAENIIKGFNQLPEAGLVTFKTKTIEGNDYWPYPKQPQILNTFEVNKTLSIEIVLKKSVLQKKKLYFDENFGLGAIFQDSENYIFLNEFQKNKPFAFFYPSYLAKHKSYSSSDDVASDRLLFARAARSYYKNGKLAYLFVAKFAFLLWKKGYISFSKISHKLKQGFSGIEAYKNLYNK